MVPSVEQRDASQCKDDAQSGLHRQFLLEYEGHNQSHQHRIDEQERGGYSGIHIVVTEEERERRQGHEKAHDYQRYYLFPLEPEIASPGLNHDTQQRNGEQIPEEEHRIGVHSLLVERKREQRIHSVRCRRNGPQHITFQLRIHEES